MEAMDLLLMACHAQTLNLFVESFLKMIQKLLEDANPSLQIMATNSVRLKIISLLIKFNHLPIYSLSSLLISRKMHRRTIGDTIFSSPNSHQCVTEVTITLR